MVACQEVTDARVTDELRERADREVIVFTNDGRTLFGHVGVLFIMRHFGAQWRLANAVGTAPVLTWFSAVGYRVLATHRRRFAPWLFRVDYDALPDATSSEAEAEAQSAEDV